MENRIAILALIILICHKSALWGQEFTTAPAPNLKNIIEWVTDVEKDSLYRGNVHHFDPQGDLITFFNQFTGVTVDLGYGDEGQLRQKTYKKGGQINNTISYRYGPDHRVEEWKPLSGGHYKTLFFYDEKDRLIENKAYVKKDVADKTFLLDQRIIYYYDERDSLRGEMHYDYGKSLELSDGTPRRMNKHKILYYYNPEDDRKTRVEVYDADDQLSYITTYQYYPDGRLKTISEEPVKDGIPRKVEYVYQQGGRPWQKIELFDNTDRTVTVYKNGLPVRQRAYDGEELVEVINYQYVFY